ncbi:hypothetical protein BC834DRAFT_965730 [Gloeopeniophorella convolvens]|nr:hypothetical protein BC834DRAFT_965730 [Gloeopeniophorella convolvens]
MPSDQPTRLTKKQKKASAFRARSKPTTTTPQPFPASDEAPELEHEHDAQRPVETPPVPPPARARARDDAPAGPAAPAAGAGKRKRADGGGSPRAAKKARGGRVGGGAVPVAHEQEAGGEGEAGVSGEAGAEGEEEAGEGGKGKGGQRYILFIGNLKYTTTRDAIQAHFNAVCDPAPTVRLLTPKHAATKSKGCAFLEFAARGALQAALRLHQSTLDGRRINVELTAGGGGKGGARVAKVQARNKELAAQRTKRAQKMSKGEGAGGGEAPVPVQAQRFSTTSGEGAVPRTKRTWTVGGADDGGAVHRGGKKAKKARGAARAKSWGTGVNALPVG